MIRHIILFGITLNMIICITGTPGVGKSTIAKRLAKRINAEILDLEEIAKKEKIVKGYDRKTNSYVIDETKLTKAVKKHISKEKSYVVPNHLAQFISPKITDFCFVLRYNPIKLARRLQRRKYPKRKIEENAETEILDSCLIEAIQNKHRRIHEIDTTNRKAIDVADEIIRVMKGRKKNSYGKIKWMNKPKIQKIMEKEYNF